MLSDPRYWLGFSLVPEIGPRRLANLLRWFGDLGSAWTASERDLLHAGLDKQPTTNLLRIRKQIDLDVELRKVERADARIVTLADNEYPPLLKKLPDAPTLLYVRGSLTNDDSHALSIVGTRRATTYGRDAAYQLSKQLAGQGVTVISGLAHGIDTAAHKGALESRGRTIAIMGSGVDVIYPRDNAKLAQQITTSGAIISEFPIGMHPEARNFPRRNRVISGMSLGVLVVEAPEKSGALITASIAADQGREVFAVPGNIFSPSSTGTNRLIQDGAKLVMNVGDILDELQIVHREVQTQTIAEHIVPGNPTEAELLQHLGADPIHIDDLVRLCGMPVALVSSTLTILELKGLARTAGHMQYCLIQPN